MSPLTPQFALLAIGLIAGIEAAKVNSPTQLVQCQPYAISWTEAQKPIYLSAVEGTNTGATPLIKFPVQSDATGSYTWPAVNITAGTTITLVINDASGQPNFSSQVTVQDGASDCLNGGSSSTPASTGAAASSASTGATTPATKPAAAVASSPAASSGMSTMTAGSNASHPSTAGSSSHTSAPVTSSTASNGTSSGSTGSGSASGSKGMSSTTNTIILGAAAAAAGALLGAGLL